jgi:hypothetical protein
MLATSNTIGAKRYGRTLAQATLVALVALSSTSPVRAAQVTISGPAGSGVFGASVTLLPNGNFVVLDNEFDAPPLSNVGAVYLYRADGVLMSTLQGSSANDQVGNGGVTVLQSGNFVIRSGLWRNGPAANAGAVTFASASTGVNGVVSPSNSLVGSVADDAVGNITPLANGNYVVSSPLWNLGATADVGAVTWGSGITGISGAVTSGNSLIGSRVNDQVGQAVVALANGNYVVQSPVWDNGIAINAGAATFGPGGGGLTGVISSSNSLIGTTSDDNVGAAVTRLSNANYVVQSANWDNGAVVNAGAATFASGTTGISGIVAVANSLVGDQANDQVGAGVTALTNGNYVVRSPQWRNGAIINAGAATFGPGDSGISGLVTISNSLVGSNTSDSVGSLGVAAVGGGNYVVLSPSWSNGAIQDVGAASYGSGTTGVSGPITSSNSLLGNQANDQVGSAGVVVLSNGNYVVLSPNWDNGATLNVGASTFGSSAAGATGAVSVTNSLVGSTAGDLAEATVTALSNGNYVVNQWRWNDGTIVDAGAVTWGSGATGIAGVISPSNSLVGSNNNDQVGSVRAIALTNGNYVVCSPNWDFAGISNLGAATFASGTTGATGPVAISNSLVGTLPNDQVGQGAFALSNGNYVVLSPNRDAGIVANAGAATFAMGVSGIIGEVNEFNSLVGSSANDSVGSLIGPGGSMALPNGHYVIRSPLWNNGAATDAGAVTLALSDGSAVGPITEANSVMGNINNAGLNQVYAYDPLRNQLIVGEPNTKRLVLHRPGIATSISVISDAPDPSEINEAVQFTAEVSTATSGAPSDGQVRFLSSHGETCADTTPTPVSANTVSYSCALSFNTTGTFEVQAEYLGSLQYAYSGMDIEVHTVSNEVLFANGFE